MVYCNTAIAYNSEHMSECDITTDTPYLALISSYGVSIVKNMKKMTMIYQDKLTMIYKKCFKVCGSHFV